MLPMLRAQGSAKRLGARDAAKLDEAMAASGSLSKRQRDLLAGELKLNVTQV